MGGLLNGSWLLNPQEADKFHLTAAMTDPTSPKHELLRSAYNAFNNRDIDWALALMTPDVAWPRAFKGGFVRGGDEVRAYWTEQWSEINPTVEPVSFHSEDPDHIVVGVHQVVRGLDGTIVADDHVTHRFTLNGGLIQMMEVLPPATVQNEEA